MAGNANSGRRQEKIIREAMLLELADYGPDRKGARLLARALLKKAMDGDVAALKEAADRIDGKVPQGVIGGDDGDNPLKMEATVIVTGVPRPADSAGN